MLIGVACAGATALPSAQTASNVLSGLGMTAAPLCTEPGCCALVAMPDTLLGRPASEARAHLERAGLAGVALELRPHRGAGWRNEVVAYTNPAPGTMLCPTTRPRVILYTRAAPPDATLLVVVTPMPVPWPMPVVLETQAAEPPPVVDTEGPPSEWPLVLVGGVLGFAVAALVWAPWHRAVGEGPSKPTVAPPEAAGRWDRPRHPRRYKA